MSDLLNKHRISKLTISLCSPEEIRARSQNGTNGKVETPETINHRTLRPEPKGLLCERIFGPFKNFECACGKYKGIIYKNTICDICSVEVNFSSVRKERMGHIELATEIVLVWFYRYAPNKIGNLLGISSKKLENMFPKNLKTWFQKKLWFM